MKKIKEVPSKNFWSLYIVCLFVLIYILMKSNLKLDLLLIIAIPFLNLFFVYFVLIIHIFVDMLLGKD